MLRKSRIHQELGLCKNDVEKVLRKMTSKNLKKSDAHILFIVENNAVPTDIRVWREAKTARQAGYDVSVISPVDKKHFKKYEVREGIKIYRHPVRNLKGGKLNQIVEYANAFFWEAILCFGLFFKSRFDIIHGANPPDHLFALAFIFRIFGVKYIFDHHDLSPELYMQKFGTNRNAVYSLLKIMEKLSCLSAHIVISTNESYKKHIVENYKVPQGKIYIVRNDPELPEPEESAKQKRNAHDQVSRIIYVGSINPQDGVDMVIRVMHILVNEYFQKNVQCLIVGDGACLSEIRDLCTKLGMDPYISFAGYIYDRDRLKAYLKEADICLETAPCNELNRKSTFIKLMEYMAAGKPIVAFDLDETRFTVQDSALLVQPEDLHAYAKAICGLIQEPSTRKELGDKGKRRIIEELNWGRASRQLLNAYESLTLQKL